MKIPLCVPMVDDVEINEVIKVLKSGWYAHGPKNEEFESKFAEYHGVKYALALNSCTSALQLSMLANNIKGEVIIPSFTWVATANSIVTSNAKPVFADINVETGMLDPKAIEACISPRTEAIMPVHYGGSVAEMDTIQSMCVKHGLLLVEDTAETIGGKYKNKLAGTFGIGCFSFYPTKNMTTGEGGMLTTNDTEFAQKAKALIGHGIDKSAYDRELNDRPWIRSASYAGFNFRLTNFQAAMGVEQLKKLDKMNELRINHSLYLQKHLSSIEKIELMLPPGNVHHVYQMFTIRVDSSIRREFVNYLRKNGIGSSVHFDPPVHQQPYYYNNFDIPSLPMTEKLCSEIVTLPMFPQLTIEQLDYMISNIINFFNHR